MIDIAHSGIAIRTAWHPEPQHTLIVTDRGNVAVQTGQVQGQLNTSEIISI